jgi:hypothetical protein
VAGDTKLLISEHPVSIGRQFMSVPEHINDSVSSYCAPSLAFTSLAERSMCRVHTIVPHIGPYRDTDHSSTYTVDTFVKKLQALMLDDDTRADIDCEKSSKDCCQMLGREQYLEKDRANDDADRLKAHTGR